MVDTVEVMVEATADTEVMVATEVMAEETLVLLL